jgi:NADPH:quinone reductase-like Zn-dependent oxidoreductase
VLVEIEAVGVNYRDAYEIAAPGYGSSAPALVGVEGAGPVRDSGERVAWSAVPAAAWRGPALALSTKEQGSRRRTARS